MENLLRFSDYDIFAYITAGFAALAAWDYVFGTHWIVGADWSAAAGVVTVFAAYVAGHIAAWPAAWLLERRFVRRVLGTPSAALFGKAPPGRFSGTKRKLFPDYYTPLDCHVADRVRLQAVADGQAGDSGEGLFWAAFARAKCDAMTYARMDGFLKLYGFCRNIAFVGIVAAVAIIAAMVWGARAGEALADARSHLLWASVSLLAGVAMFYRYLKFHRLYAVEVFLGYINSNLLVRGK
ncbi:MAG TPA: hypothetical protein VEK82_03465 [Stellaceae bacterium]|nr:hypothetical protein [Stellaceae bacterium]